MIKIGLLGLGTVGSGVVTIMEKNKNAIKRKVGTGIELKKVLVSQRNKERQVLIEKDKITDRYQDIIEDPEIDLVVELIGGEEPARQYITEAVEKGKSVVTANKLIIARYGREILEMARNNGVQVCFEGSVAGGIPVIRPLKESFAANKIQSLYGILNGTTNYILSKMTGEGKDFSAVLEQAQKLGYAERDPSSDIDGEDAAYKIAILASIAFETSIKVESVYKEGIQKIELEDIQIAKELGYVIKLLAVARRIGDELDIRVHPAFVSREHPLALVNDVYNALYLNGDAVGEVMSYGKGAGQMPTASAVVADIIQAANSIHNQNSKNDLLDTNLEHKIMNIDDIENSFYLRLQVNDKPGVLARIAQIFGDNKVSLATVIQKDRLTEVVPIVLITHPVKEKFMFKSLKGLEELADVVKINNFVRVAEL